MMRSRGIAIPYNSPALVRDILDTAGTVALFNEMFDRESWRDLPSRIRVVRGHERHHPLGWGTLRSGDDALHVTVEWLDSQAGRDAHAEVEAKLMPGLSIGFLADLKADKVTREAGRVPTVLRRGVELREISLVSEPAYAGARISPAGVTSAEDEQLLASANRAVHEFRVTRRLDDVRMLAPSMARIAERKRADEQRRLDDERLLASAIETAARSRALTERIAAERERKREPVVEPTVEEWAERRWREEIRAENARLAMR